jgi:hypothetical protein
MNENIMLVFCPVVALISLFALDFWIKKIRLSRSRKLSEAIRESGEETRKPFKRLDCFSILSFSTPKTTGEILVIAAKQDLRPLSLDQWMDVALNNGLEENFPPGKYVNLLHSKGCCKVFVTDGSDSKWSLRDFDRVWEEGQSYFFLFEPFTEHTSEVPEQTVFDDKQT